MESFKEFVDKSSYLDEDAITKNFINDYSADRNAKYIYEEFFSTLLNEDVSLDTACQLIDEARIYPSDTVLGVGIGAGKASESIVKDGAEKIAGDISKLSAADKAKLPFVTALSKTGIPVGNVSDIMTGTENFSNLKLSLTPYSARKAFLDAGKKSGLVDSSLLKSMGHTDTMSARIAAGESPLLSNPVSTAKKAGIFGTIKNFFSSIIGKIQNAVSGSAQGSVGYYLNKGITWMTVPSHMHMMLGGIGGILALGIIIKALKKKNQLKKYKELQQIYDYQSEQAKAVNEGNLNGELGSMIIESLDDQDTLNLISETFDIDVDKILEENFDGNGDGDDIDESFDGNGDGDDIDESFDGNGDGDDINKIESDKKEKYFKY